MTTVSTRELAVKQPAQIVTPTTVTAGPDTNPYRIHAVASALVMGVAGLGAGWSVVHDYARTDLAAAVFFLTILLFAACQGRFNAWEQDRDGGR